MSEDLYQNRYRIPSARAAWHNYNGGLYFVTICTHDHGHFFGEIVNGEMQLSEIGEYADMQLKTVASHYEYAEIPLWVVMPNHIHAMIAIDGYKTPHKKRDVGKITVETFHETSLQQNETPLQQKGTTTPIERATVMQSWLSVVVRQFKQSVTRFAKSNHIYFAWQARFHDHIVQNVDEMNMISNYIKNNPARWGADRFYN